MATKDVIAANLRILRKVRRMSQPDLAGKVGISPRTVARLEAAQVADPSINHVRALARALGVTVDLLTESELAPLTIAVPARLKPMLESPAGMRWLAETLEEGRLQSRHDMAQVVAESRGDASAETAAIAPRPAAVSATEGE